MGLRINTNVASIAAQRSFSQSSRKVEQSMKQLATGSRFANPMEGAGEFAISEHLRGQISGMKAARNNADFAASFVAVGEGGLNEQNNILIRLREVAIQSASDNFSDTEREFLNMEAQQLVKEFDRIAKTTSFGSKKLLMGTGDNYEFQVGAYSGADNIITYKANTDTTASNIGITGVDVSDKGDARDSLKDLDKALTKIGAARASFAAISSRLNSVSNNATNQIENLAAAQSRLGDTDIAEAFAQMTQGQVQQQVATAVLAQANQQPNAVMKLINF